MELDFAKFVEWGFLGLIAGILGVAVRFLQRISDSIVKLNSQVGILLERTDWHSKTIENHEHRISKLEIKRGN